MKQNKSKKVDGVDLPPSSFAYVGDEQDTNTWKLPIHFPSSESKSINHIKNALTRFDETKGIPDSERRTVWLTLAGAAKAYGLRVEPKEFQSIEARPVDKQNSHQAETETKSVGLELKAIELQLTRANGMSDYAEIAAIIANADRRTDAILKSLRLL
jgi:hypothetical protein